MHTTHQGTHAQTFAHFARMGAFAPIDASVNLADLTDSDHAEFQRMALHQQAFNALARAQRELLAHRSDYTRAVQHAERAIAAMTALALMGGRA